MLLELVGIALLQSLACLMMDQERFRKLLQLIGGVAITLVLLSRVMTFDFAAYASALRESGSLGSWDAKTALAENEKLNRRYIEQACAAYILDKAGEMGVPLMDAKVTLAWNTDGYWYPVHAELTVPNGNGYHPTLADTIQTDLGIPLSEQIWREEGERNGSQ